VLHNFAGPDGASPVNLVRDPKGNLYGAAMQGGTAINQGGTFFKLDPAGNFTLLGSFDYMQPTGSSPYAITRDKSGNLYVSNWDGGDLDCESGMGCGTIFKVDRTGNQTILHTFTGEADSGYCSGLTFDSEGDLYGFAGGWVLPPVAFEIQQ
jgi:uncharacterized repeat protein (TIGR03803 family)